MSLRRRSAILDAALVDSDLAVVITDAAPADAGGPRIVFTNAAFTRMCGYAPEEVYGRPPRMLQGPGTDRTAASRLGAAVAAGATASAELVNYRKDGTPYTVRVDLMPVRGDGGAVEHFVAVEREVEPARASAHGRGVGDELLAAVLTALEDGVALVDDGGRIVLVNAALTRLVGRSAGELVGASAGDLLEAGERRRAGELREAALASGEGYRERTRVLHASGGVVELDVATSVVALEGGRRLALAVFRAAEGTPLLDAGAEGPVRFSLRLDGLLDAAAAGAVGVTELEHLSALAAGVAARLGGEAARPRPGEVEIAFCGVSRTEAAQRAAAAAREIRQRLFGETGDPRAARLLLAGPAEREALPETSMADLVRAGLTSPPRADRAAVLAAMRDALAAGALRLREVGTSDGAATALHEAALPEPLAEAAALALRGGDEELLAEADFLMLGLVGRFLQGAGGNRLFVPAHLATLSHQRTSYRFLGLCRTALGPVRDRAVLLLEGVPEDIGKSRLLDAVYMLGGAARAVALPGVEALARYLDQGFPHAGIVWFATEDLLRLRPGSPHARVLDWARLRRWRVLARGGCGTEERARLRALGVGLVRD
jgi:PAS domain S-box-containing protein